MATKYSDTLPQPAVERPASPYFSRIPAILSSAFPITWEGALVIGLALMGAFTRLWNLGARVMSHDESLHVYYSWLLASGKGFAHNPMMHGPLLFETTALMDFFFGGNDFTSRLVPVIAGIFIIAAVPQLLKPWLGRAGALITSALLLISPFVLYYSRYIRHDIIVLAWAFLAVIAIFRYLEERRDRDLLLLAIALALMFSTMEITFFYLAIFVGFLALRGIARQGLHWLALRQSEEFDLLVVIASLGAFFSSPIALLGLNPIWQRLTGAAYVDVTLLSSQSYEWALGGTGIRLLILVALFSVSAIALGIWWGKERWLKLFVVFGGITVLAFTTFLTNPGGLGTGFIGSLGYWMSQQAVSRGGQPWYYYLVIFPIYEYLPLLGGIGATIYFGIRNKSLSYSSRSWVVFLIWWGVAIIVGLSLAGEKMPWLSTHIAIPSILLTGWWIGLIVQNSWALEEERRKSLLVAGRRLILAVFAFLALLTLRTSLFVNYLHYDYSTEFIDYAHGAPGVKWALDDLQEIADHTGIGRKLKVAYDSDVSWPMTWYLKDYPNQSFYGDQPNRQALDAEVVIAGPKDWQKVEAILKDTYHRFEVIRMWWPLEDYKNLTWSRISNAVSNPAMRGALWEILWNRDYRQYAELTGQDIDPPSKWPLSERMRVYVRKDIALQMLSLSLGKTMIDDLPKAIDAYASIEKNIQPAVALPLELSNPRNVAAAPDASLFVLDSGNARVVHTDTAGKILHTWGSRTPESQPSPAEGTFNDPWGIAVDPQGQVYVADTWNHRIQKFKPDGTFLLQWGTSGTADQGNEYFWGPRGITTGLDGRVYVTDTGNKRVVAYNPEGKFLFTFDSSGEGQLDEPVGITAGPDGNIYIADTWNARVAVFTPDGQFLKSWPVQGWAGSSVENKPYLAVDAQGRVYITDPEGYRVIIFSSSGEPLEVFGQYGPEEDSFVLPLGLAVSEKGDLWVVDSANNRLSQYPTTYLK